MHFFETKSLYLSIFIIVTIKHQALSSRLYSMIFAPFQKQQNTHKSSHSLFAAILAIRARFFSCRIVLLRLRAFELWLLKICQVAGGLWGGLPDEGGQAGV